MVGGLEVFEDEATCFAQLLFGLAVEDTAVDKGRVVAYGLTRRVSSVRRSVGEGGVWGHFVGQIVFEGGFLERSEWVRWEAGRQDIQWERG